MTWVDITNLRGPRGQDGKDGEQGPAGPVNIGLNPAEPIVWDQAGGFTFNLIDGSQQTVNLPIASAQSAGLLGAGGQSPATGRRNIGALLEAGSGSIFVQRIGEFVELNLYGVTPPGSPSSNITPLFGTTGFPRGFRPNEFFSAPLTTTGSPPPDIVMRMFITSSGRLDVSNPGAALYGLFVYRTADPWPSSLPGIAA